MNKILERLDLTIQRKTTESPNQSHTAKLLKKGTEKCAEKFGEEAIELIVASVKKKKKEIIGEAADALYHMLASREGISGIEEKRKRNL